mgnify:CR=1 FL=1|jgi:zona occludens toxin (predicted ATPase)
MDNIQKSILKNKNWDQIKINNITTYQNKKLDINELYKSNSKIIKKDSMKKKLVFTIISVFLVCLFIVAPSL